MNSILEKVNLYLDDKSITPINNSPDEKLLLVVVETLDEMGVILNKDQQKKLLTNIVNMDTK